MNALIQQIQLADKYSRLKDDGTKETWPEVVERVISFFQLSLIKQGRADTPSEWWPLIRHNMLNMSVLPSMRVVQMAGPTLMRDNVGAYNCLAGDTEYVTQAGIRTLAETVGTTQRVLAKDGVWRPATVWQFGEAPVNVITFRPGSRSRTSLRKIVRATADHGWLTTRGPVRNLQVGDEVIANGQIAEFNAHEWVRGFLFGDGTVQDNCARVRLCGMKANDLPTFELTGARISYPESNDGDPTVSWKVGIFSECKHLPQAPSPSWMNGYMAADGYNAERQPTLSTTRKDAVDFIQRHAAELGVAVTGLTVWTKDSNFGERQPLYKLGIRPAADVVWRVLSIEPTDETVPVFCVTEPITHTFTIAHGLTSLNCAYIALDSPKTLGELLYVMMQGTGIGFSVEAKHIHKWPEVHPKDFTPNRATWIIEDSTEGWVEAYNHGIATWMEGVDVDFDFSRIRPAGAPLKTKGGYASGPEPFKFLLDKTRQIILGAQGRRLRSFEVHRLATLAGSIVVVGGVRRAAQISLSDADDREMRECKSGEFWINYPELSMANNSAVIESKLQLAEEWDQLRASGSGERGLFNSRGPIPSRRSEEDFGTNPCLTGDTVIATLDGGRTFKELADAGHDVQVYAWDAETKLPVVRTMRKPHKTRVNVPVLEITFDSGLKVKSTYDHNFYNFRGRKVQAQNLRVGQSVRAWSMSKHRDGHLRVHGWDAGANKAVHQWAHRMVWEAVNGPIPEGFHVHHLDNNPEHNVVENMRLVTSVEHNQLHYADRFANGFDGSAFNHKVVGIQTAGNEDVYNGCVDDVHTYVILDPHPIAGVASGIVSANCGEILLRSRQFCNLSIAVARPDDTPDTLAEKVRVATLIGTIQSCLTFFPNLPAQWRENCESERLLGVDITGTMDCPFLQSTTTGTALYLGGLRNETIKWNREFASILNINPSTSITCNKPSGNSSQLLDSSSGIHPRYAPFYIRRLRIGQSTPLANKLRGMGVPVYPEVGASELADALVWVFELPAKSPEGAVVRANITALEQLEYWKMWKVNWTEHNPSCTIYVGEDEWDAVFDWVFTHWAVIGGLSFLPRNDHIYQLAPYVEIDKNEFERRVAAIRWSGEDLHSFAGEEAGATDAACAGGFCEF